jgi:hypothetical protein
VRLGPGLLGDHDGTSRNLGEICVVLPSRGRQIGLYEPSLRQVDCETDGRCEEQIGERAEAEGRKGRRSGRSGLDKSRALSQLTPQHSHYCLLPLRLPLCLEAGRTGPPQFDRRRRQTIPVHHG